MQHKQGIDRSDCGRGGQVHSVFENFHGNFWMVKCIQKMLDGNNLDGKTLMVIKNSEIR